MKVLVTTATRHRSTLEIGQALGRALAADGIVTDVRPVEEVDTIDRLRRDRPRQRRLRGQLARPRP